MSIEPPVRTSTPLSQADASAGGESSSELVSTLQREELEQQQQQQDQRHAPQISKAAYDAIFGRAASASSASREPSPSLAHHDLYAARQSLQQQHDRQPIVAHEDDSYHHFMFEHRQQLMSHNFDGSTQQVVSMMAATSMGRSPRMMPMPNMQMQVPSNHDVPSNHHASASRSQASASTTSQQQHQQHQSPPTALMIMRRRRSNSTDANNSGSNSSGNNNNIKKDELNASGSNGSGTASSNNGNATAPKSSPKIRPVHAPHNEFVDPNDPLNYNATIQQLQQQHQQQQAAAMTFGKGVPFMHHPHIQQPHLTAMRYNSSLHSTLGGYPMGTPTQLTHPSVTMELIARDRARWDADYYSSNHGMDYAMDYHVSDYGGFFGGGPMGFRGMQGNGLEQLREMERFQGLYQPKHVQNAHLPPPKDHHQHNHRQRNSSSPLTLAHHRLQGNAAGGVPASPGPSSHVLCAEVNMTPKTRRVFQERDYKTDRVWQEDDHTSTTSPNGHLKATARHVPPERRNTDKTSNTTQSSKSGSPMLPSVPQLRGGVPTHHHAMQRDPQHAPHGFPRRRSSQMPAAEEYDIMSYNTAMAQYYHQPPPHHHPPTPGRGAEKENRVRQMSDISSICGSHPQPIYPSPNGHIPPHHHYHGLAYPSTPGSIGSMTPAPALYQQHQDIQGGRAWVDPYPQAGRQHAAPPQPAEKAVKASKGDESSPEVLNEVKTPEDDPPFQAQPPSSAPPASRARSDPSPLRSQKRVSFSTLHIRTYETILGDNPSCSGGPSLGLGWRYDPAHLMATVDEYEAHLAFLRGALPNGDPVPIPPEDLVLHRFEREAILLNTGYTRQDLAESVRALNRVKNRRRQTVHNLPVAFIEERAEVVKRTLKRWLLKKDHTRSMYEDWKRKCNQGRAL